MKQQKGNDSRWWVWVFISFLVVITVITLAITEKDYPVRPTVEYSVTDAQVFVYVNYSHAKHEFRCNSFDRKILLNRTQFEYRLIMPLDTQIETRRASDNILYRIRTMDTDIGKDIGNNPILQEFKKDAIMNHADEISCWTYLMPHGMVTATYYDEGFSETRTISDYRRILYRCKREPGMMDWACDWFDYDYTMIDEYNIKDDFHAAIIYGVIDE